MDLRYDFEDSDELLVRRALLAAYPPHRSEFSMRRGEQIIRAAAAERPPRRSPVGSRVAACIAASFTLLAGTAGVAGAALPGQPLYPLKRMVERAMIAVAPDDGEAARLELRFAQRRLQEASVVTEAPVVDDLADDFDKHVETAETLAGDDVADQVDRLRDAQTSGEPAVVLDGKTTATPTAEDPAPAPVVAVAPQPSASPSPTASPSPSAHPTPTPSPSASPAPSANPSPNPSVSAMPEGPSTQLPSIPERDAIDIRQPLPSTRPTASQGTSTASQP